MRFAPIGLIALTVAVGCARWGYHALPSPDGRDAGKDAAVQDAASPMDASKPDATDPAGSDQDSSTRDAGSSDSGSAPLDSGPMDDDAGSDAGAMPIDAGANDLCPKRADALFCDGYDDPMLKNWPLKLQMNGSGMHITKDPKPYSGEGALRATTGAPGPTNYVRYGANVFDHQKSGDIWLRYFQYIPSSTMITASFSSAAIGELESPNFSVYLLIRPDGVDVSTGSAFYRSAIVFPRDKWVCVELHVEIDDTAGAYEAYLDGTRIVRTGMPTDTLPTNGYSTFDVGIHATASNQGPVEVFVDDVVAGPVQVGCD